MATDAQLIFADHAGRFYAREYGFPPVTGRLLGYLIICDPPQQTIADLADALLASRSAIAGAVKLLEGYHAVRRTRAAGERVDRVSIDPAGLEPKGFAAEVYQEQADLAREALALLKDAPPGRRAVVAEAAAFYDFLAQRLPAVLDEWRAHRDNLPAEHRRGGSDGSVPG
jgi:DNA-binding MarR family transcriptional regulator